MQHSAAKFFSAALFAVITDRALEAGARVGHFAQNKAARNFQPGCWVIGPPILLSA